MQRTVTPSSFLIRSSTCTSPLKCVNAKPAWIGVGAFSADGGAVKYS
jgi:hypothetical protein